MTQPSTQHSGRHCIRHSLYVICKKQEFCNFYNISGPQGSQRLLSIGEGCIFRLELLANKCVYIHKMSEISKEKKTKSVMMQPSMQRHSFA